MTDKATLRKNAEQTRAALARPEHGARLAAFASELPISSGVVSGYCACRSEADPKALMAALASRGLHLALPVIVQKAAPLRFHRWQEGDELVLHRFGVAEPLPTADIVEPDVLLVPLLAFDDAGYRLGYGGGFYDRTLAALRAKKPITAIGIAYAGQRIDHLPRDAYDQRLDAVLTEEGLTRF
ncbi:5-formyltetrahydrofolate cyclo-ligase [Rhizomicrobium palustre]|uniref:5-formyltetrahydrofolate cyclo-ligase n=1 Tax=Rhizomicrobium palustre TaxID=189966 RepID=A0A846N0K5_9PROT|nr:5-formyltetrahydrofolate cyclo-ligase [Rhizomicrobium palustre]NIK88710.1 5-formyltetrahydrofolate cyclo-ligase [Rhizomicrobium palustre]